MGSTYILISIVIIVLFFLLRNPKIRGKIGEAAVASSLEGLPKDEYKVLNDVTIPTATGSSQIDHLVVSIYGIFVIETKNYKGWIYGGENAEYWTQNIYGRKYQLYNPILQNQGHVRALRRVLKEYEPLPILPIVAFSGRADIKVNTKDACVVYWGQIRQVINQFEERRLSISQVNKICNAVKVAQLEPGTETNRQHRQDAFSAREQKYDAIASGRCPRCGGKLVLRSGRYGQFYGCSNYPKCKFTHLYQ